MSSWWGGWVEGRWDEVFLATKFGVVHSEANPRARRVDSTPGYARCACEASLRRLGVDHIDLFHLHRRNPDVPVAETMDGVAELVAAGKVRYLGLPEVSAGTLRRACAVAPVAVLQSEYSLWTRGLERGSCRRSTRRSEVVTTRAARPISSTRHGDFPRRTRS
ncbi:aldo/keto reductase [Streptomyces sp. NPDC052101]|uniref:aldo/keto reductase n=1 Tax=Streptomyces sp. NPDC052101 TaxID=3155763 RepID=UPI00342A5FEA